MADLNEEIGLIQGSGDSSSAWTQISAENQTRVKTTSASPMSGGAESRPDQVGNLTIVGIGLRGGGGDGGNQSETGVSGHGGGGSPRRMPYDNELGSQSPVKQVDSPRLNNPELKLGEISNKQVGVPPGIQYDSPAAAFKGTAMLAELNPRNGADQQVKNDKTVKQLDSPQYKKLSPEEQAKVAKEVADQIAKTGLADRAVRDNLRTKMLQVYLGGDLDSRGNEEKMKEFVKQVNDNLPQGMSLKLAQPDNDKDYKKFLEQAGDNINKQAGMKIGAYGQIQLWKTAEGQEKMIAKTHYAASIRK